MNEVFKVKKVNLFYGEKHVLKDIDIDIYENKVTAFIGPSGCGKSTLLNMICGILTPSKGNIFFDEQDVTNLPPDKRNIGMVFQNYALYPHLNVLENIAFPLEIKKVPKKERFQKATEIAKLVKVDNLLKRFPSELSGGQQQRVAIARALIKNPKILLMDEPLSNLDARLRLEMREEIRRIQKETGITTVFVTHDQEEAMSISDSILLMKDGVLIQNGLCQELYVNPNCLFVAEFLGNPPANKIIQEDKILAIRPEAFTLDPNGTEAEIQFISEMGKDQIVTMTYLGYTVRAILNLEDSALSAGSKIKVSVKQKGLFTFDKEGRRI